MVTILVMGIERALLVAGIPGRSQGIWVEWVQEKRNSSITRFMLTERERRVRRVEGGLEWMKLWV